MHHIEYREIEGPGAGALAPIAVLALVTLSSRMSHLYISAAHKSSGKTTISVGIAVQPFKKGSAGCPA